ncbi:Methionine transporter MetT [Halanaerobium saccharolyticum subsp. saccharolyticum DSM 6643]|uniref:Methionine transporter MetT n=1 Tax=Halanaerobium saccharolyticum subsp. saccharolyticum DSM 6643 TaxID=1293054 RepID=M5DZW3_9FIRM|nr:Na+/H+ antiporter NhaC family protein [Halanaerobium saccharolyticum]CCU78757.1 Methionine transporter MetT [Halanaerobium saccharolyticum subsp. saccharolyticum DSM 6643]
MSKNKGRLIGLTPLILFLVLFVGTGLITGDFDNMPLLVAFFISAGYALLLNKEGEKLSITKKIDMFMKGGGEPTIVLLVVIFLLAGAFYSVNDAMGAVESTVNFGLTILPTNFILPGIFAIGCIISFAMGTSMGTVTALAPIAVGVADQTGISIALALGVVVGGAMFGDNLSFVSDTTIAATRTQGVELRDKFKMNFLIVLPAVIVTLIILMFIPINTAAIDVGTYSLVNILPYIGVIISALIGLNVMVVLVIGIGIGSIVGLIGGSFTVIELLGFIQRGMGWMQNLAIIAMIIGGIVELMKHYGGIDYLLNKVTANIKSKKGGEFGIAMLVSLIDIATANNTISIITAGPLAKDISKEYDIDPRRTASLLDIFSASFQGFIPYGGQLLVAAGIGAISPVKIMPFTIYPILLFVFGSLAIILGIPNFKNKAEDSFAETDENIENIK